MLDANHVVLDEDLCGGHGLPADRAALVQGVGRAAAAKLLDRIPGLTALLTMSDVMAIGAMRAIRDRNLRIPEDVSVIGFDGLTLSQYLTPRLTTIWQDTDRMAQRAVEILLSQMEDGKPPIHEIVPYRLIEGESVRNISHLPPR